MAAFRKTARAPVRVLRGSFGGIRVSPVEELLVERILVSMYPQDYPPARECAMKLLAAMLQGEVETDWTEVRRLAQSRAYDNWNEARQLIHEQAQALQVRSPCDSDK